MFRWFNRFVLFLIPAALVFAQAETATLRGRVTDSSGTGLEGIQLVIFETGKELSVRDISTGAGGAYDAPFLKPGSYVVKIDANHFQTFQAEGIVLMAGQVRRLDPQLKPEAHDETVLINEPPPWCNRKMARFPASSTSSWRGRTLRLWTCTHRYFRC